MKFSIIAIALLGLSCSGNPEPEQKPTMIDNYLAQYTPYEMPFDASGYSGKEKTLLKKLVEASEYLDTIYWRQTSLYGMHLRDSLLKVEQTPHVKALLTLLNRNGGPFELLNDYATFVGDQQYYPGDEIYPRGMSAEEFDRYYATLPKDEQKKFMSPYTVIRSNGAGGYVAIPYHEEYKAQVQPIAKLLNECADLAENASFAKFLRLKAQALLTDSYFDADVAWIDMKGSKFDMVFGPFETYSDGIKGVKAKYESSIEVIDQDESRKLDVYTAYLKQLEENLPIPSQYKSPANGLTATFVVVRDIIRKGEAAYGYQAVATNLPNDPEVHEKKGTKKTFWKNMLQARFNAIIRPVSVRLIDSTQQRFLSDEGFFEFVVMHEICHAVGPRTVKVGPKKGMPVNAAIGPDFNAIEEAKADIAGLYSLVYLMDHGVVPAGNEKNYFVSYLGSMFRSIRFGFNEAHGRAAAISLNYLTEKGAIVYDATSKRWSINFTTFRDGLRDLAHDLLVLEGDGDEKNVSTFTERWTRMSPQVQTTLDEVRDLPIDVLPHYTIKWE